MNFHQSDKMSITMISNAMSHHQIPFCKYMARQKNISFKYIATKPLSEERKMMGYTDLNHLENYIIRSYESENSLDYAKKLAFECDFVIFGSAPYSFIKKRIKKKKWTFIYSERIFKKGIMDWLNLRVPASYFLHYAIVQNSRLRLLCSSAYAASDFRYFGFNKKRMYKWGYFPPNLLEDIDALFEKKKRRSIVWVGRMVPWKHPEMAVLLAEKLVAENHSFHLTMVGNGELFNYIEEMIQEKNLTKYITLTGALNTAEVRNVMNNTEILLATSDFQEGWGATINEGMSSGCSVIASHAMGATRFLIENGYNGCIFKNGNLEEAYKIVVELLNDPLKIKKFGKNAMISIQTEWNGENAASKLISLFVQLKNGNLDYCYSDGICSLAEIISQNWYRGDNCSE